MSSWAYELVIPEGTKVIGDKYRGDKDITSVVIPSSVTEIRSSAFEGCTGLTSVVIPSSVTSIGSSAFKGCSGLTSVVIPSSVTEIGDAFSGCSSLTSVAIPSSVTVIGGSAFLDCTGLTSVVIPSSVTVIGLYAFKGCTGLTSVVIPSSVTEIGDHAFEGCTGLTSVVIPSSVTNIGWSAFYGCSGLTSVEIPSSVTKIGGSAFEGCSNLSQVSCYAVNPPYYYYDDVFSKETLSDTLYVPSQGIKAYKADNVWGQFATILPLSEDAPVSITQTLTVCDNELPIKWNGHWVYGDTTLALGADTVVDLRLDINHSMETILYDTITCGMSYRNWKDPQSGTYVVTFTTATGCDSIVTLHLYVMGTELVIPEGTKEITYKDGYHGNKCITSVEIPSSVTYIGDYAFYGCTGLTSVEIPSSATEIGGWAFYGCTGLTSVQIPSSVTYIGNGTFYGCTGLTSVEIPSSVTEIGGGAFSGTGLKKVTIPGSVEYWDTCFVSCNKLQEVIIQDGVTNIGWGAFADCTGLTSVEIPSSVTSIGSIAFEGCTNLSRVSCYAVKPPYIDYYDDVFSKETLSDTLYVPFQSVEAYKADKIWGQFTTILPLSEDAPVSITQTLTVCDNELPIKWNGHWVYGDTTLALGADTVVDLRLDINHSKETVLYDTVSCGSSYQYWGWSMKNPQSGTYVDTFTTATGCDSIVTLHLYVMGTELVIPEGTKEITYKDGYHGNKCITSVEIPSSVTHIGYEAFYGCTGLTSVEIPNSVTEIGRFAFYGCTGLTSIEVDPKNAVYTSKGGILYNKEMTELVSAPEGIKGNVEIPNTVKEIGYSAFDGCGGLTSVEIPSSVTVIGGWAFYGCTGLTSVEIPSSVTRIKDGAFSGTGLKKVTIPGSVEYLDSCFCYCKSLQEVIIQNGVTSIGYGAFAGCTGLTSVEIPSSVTSIEYRAFSGCTGLTSVEIPSSVTSIGSIAFEGCTNLSRVSCYAVKPPHIDYNSYYYAFSKETLSDTLYVPSQSVEAYKADKMWGQFATILPINDGTSINITQTLTVCNNELPIKWNGHWVHSDTTLALGADTVVDLRLDINHSVKTFLYDTVTCGMSYRNWKNPQSGTYVDTFTTATGCDSIVTLHLYVMGDELVIPEGTETISYKDGYQDNKCITSVVIPSSVKEIGWSAFSGCSGLTSVEVDPKNTAYASQGGILYNKEMTGVIYVPEGIKGSVEIPSSVTRIDSSAFRDRTGLTSVEIPNSVTEIGGYAFEGCSGLTSVVIPSSVTEIGSSAFRGCTGLTSVVIPSSVTNIGWSAFDGCTGLTSIKIPSSVTEIGSSAFSSCTGLTSVVIPSSVTSIGGSAFYGCTGLTSVEIPSSVTEIGYSAFGDCTSLSRVSCYAVKPPYYYYDDVFSKETLSDTLYVPSQSIEAYKADNVWGQFATILPLSEDAPVSITQTLTVCDNELPIKWNGHWVYGDTTLALSADTVVDLRLDINHSKETVLYDTIICGMSYRDWKDPQSGTYIDTFTTATGCDSIVTLHLYVSVTELVIPEGTKTITYEDGYHGNKQMTSVVIPNSVTSIGNNAFEGCTGLQSLSLAHSIDLSMSGILSTDTLIFRGSLAEWCADPITSISYKALVIDGQVYDKNTKSVVLPEGVETIHAKAFDICPNIRTLTLPSTLIEMGDGAFKNSLSIASVTCYASEPPAAMGSTFGNYNGYLYIPCDYQSDYDIHVCWGSFKHVECIAAESSDVEDVVVEPDNVTASISWPSVDGAYGYSINISINGRELFVLNFNANGQLVNIDFSHAIQSVNPAPPTKEVTSMLRKGTSLRSMSSGFMFTVTGLEEGTTYDYTLTALDESSVSIKEYEGKFTTKGGSGILTSTEEEVNKTLFVYAQDGEIIVGGNPTEMVSIYNILGQRLYHGRGNVTFQVPSANVYIVKHGVQAIKVVVE